MTEIYAKSFPLETIEEHTEKVIQAFKQLLQIYPHDLLLQYTEFAERILWYHDQGKANIPFQNMIRKSLKMPHLEKTNYNVLPHEWLSLGFISEEDYEYFDSLDRNDIWFRDIARYCIAFHHNRNKPFIKEQVDGYIDEINNHKELLGVVSGIKKIADITNVKQKIEGKYWKTNFCYIAIFKGLLHKCDYAASAHIEPEIPFAGDYSKMFAAGLQNKGIKQLSDFQVQAASSRDKSIILTASTGAGKTEYSMNWINGDKAFYLLGIKTAVEAMHKRFKDFFACDESEKENVALLHGESIYRLIESEEKEDYDGGVFNMHTKTKQLSVPITIATADQLVPAVFKFPGFEFYYFTASYSKIVVDEVQSFSPAAIASIVVFLKEIQDLGGKFLLMTATLPPFVKEEFKNFEAEGRLVFQKHLSEIKRHVVSVIDEPIYDQENQTVGDSAKQIVDKFFAANKKILVVANTVKNAQRLFDAFAKYKPKLLHSRFIRKDRDEKEKEIFDETDYKKYPENKNKNCLWIATQIVEASLDIDFDILLTENATVDALFQRFGRIYRRREYNGSEPNIFIFKPVDARINNKIYDKDIADITWHELLKYTGCLISEEDKQNIIDEVFSDIEATDYFKKYKKMKELLILGLRGDNKRDAENLFREINNTYTVIPKDIYDAEQKNIDYLLELTENKEEKAEERLKAKKKLYDFTAPVQVFANNKELLKCFDLPNRTRLSDIDIRRLDGVKYTKERGVEFIEDYVDDSNFID